MKMFIYSLILIFVFTAISNVAQDSRGVKVNPIDENKRIALVIGNTDYDTTIGKLKNPANDATDIAQALQRLGFSLVGGKPQINLTRRQMLEQIREFGVQIKKGGVGVFYFAGHGIQVEKRNYLIPITNTLQYQEDAEFEAVDVDAVLREMEYAENGLNILILDACRNNGLPKKTRNTQNGLIEPNRKPSGVYIAFAARDGQTADENPTGRNGLYTQELLKNLESPNLRLEDIFIKTRVEVKRLSNRTQEPIEYGSLDSAFYLKYDKRFNSNSNASVENSSLSTANSLAQKALDEFMRGNYQEANELANKALQIDNKLVLALGISGGINAILLNLREAEIILNSVVKLEPKIPLFRIWLAMVYNRKQQIELSQDICKETIAMLKTPQTALDYYTRGFCNMYLDDSELALKDLSSAIAINPNFVDAYLVRGLVNSSDGNTDLAISDFTTAIEKNPKFFFAYANRAIAYLEDDEKEKALNDVTKSIELNKDNPFSYSLRAEFYAKIGEKEKAIADYNKAIELQPLNPMVYFARGIYFNKNGENEKAINDLSKAIQFNFQLNEIFLVRGELYVNNKQFDKALADFNKYIELVPNDPDGYLKRADLYEKTGKKELAEQDKIKANKLQ